MSYHEKLRKLRLERGLSFREVERATGVSFASISTIERKMNQNVKVQNIVVLARFYGVSLDWLFEEDF